jgi:hypothetical protein
VEQEVRDHEHDARDRNREAEEARDRERVRDDEHALLVALTPPQPVIRARRDQQHRRERGRDECREEDVPSRLAQLRKAVCERDGEQEGEQHLNARQRDAQLVEELDQLAVVALLRAFWHE